MKKLFTIVLAFVLVTACLCSTGVALAEENQPTEMILYAKVDDTWKNPHVWAFTEAGQGAFDAWPGQALTADPSNAGWYYTYLPATMDKVIVSATLEDGTSVQTVDVAITTKADMWLTVGEVIPAGETGEGNYSGTISYEKATTGEIPAYVRMLNIFAYLPEGWAGAQLKASGEGVETTGTMALQSDGWYLIQIPSTMTVEEQTAELNQLVITDGTEDGNKTTTIALDFSKLSADKFIPNVYVVIDKDSDMHAATAQVLYDAKPDVSPKFKVHVKVPDNWALPCIWAWSHPDGTNAYANWPGEELIENGEWYEMDVPTFVNRVIISGNLGDVQTVDVDIEAKELWIVVGGANEEGKHTATVTYEVPDLDDNTDNQPSDKPGEKPQDPENPETNVGLIVGIVIAAVVVIGGIVTFVIVKKRAK